MVGAEPAQRIIDAVADVRRVEALSFRVHPDLGGDDHVVAIAASLHPFADDRLGFSARVSLDPGRVRVRGVDEVSARLGVGVEDSKALIPIRTPAEGVASQLKWVNEEIGICQLHTCHTPRLPV